MCRWLEVVLCIAALTCGLLPALARCDISTRPPAPCQRRAMEDFAFLLAAEQTPPNCEGANDEREHGDTVAE